MPRHSRLACFSVPRCETTLHVSVSQQRTFVMPPKRFKHKKRQRMCFKIMFVWCWNFIYQVFFSMVKLGQICHFWKQPKSCFFLRPTQSHLNSLSKDNCWIIKYKSVFLFATWFHWEISSRFYVRARRKCLIFANFILERAPIWRFSNFARFSKK